jgi:hypothetical protein
VSSPAVSNGARISGRDGPSKGEDLRTWVFASDGRRELLGAPEEGKPIELGMPLVLRPCFEVHDDDSWAVMGDPNDPRTIPDKQFRGRRRNLLPLLGLPSALECTLLPTFVVRLNQLTELELDYLFGMTFGRLVRTRDGLVEVIRSATSRVQVAHSLPPGPKS